MTDLITSCGPAGKHSTKGNNTYSSRCGPYGPRVVVKITSVMAKAASVVVLGSEAIIVMKQAEIIRIWDK
jgi:hypothetical protein